LLFWRHVPRCPDDKAFCGEFLRILSCQSNSEVHQIGSLAVRRYNYVLRLDVAMDHTHRMRMIKRGCDLLKPLFYKRERSSTIVLDNVAESPTIHELKNDQECIVGKINIENCGNVWMTKLGEDFCLTAESFLIRFRKGSDQRTQYLYRHVTVQRVVTALVDLRKAPLAVNRGVERKSFCRHRFL
jgi:hypothetical protein